jgi:hypothetical protein
MRDFYYRQLIADFGEPTDQRVADPVVIEKYRRVLPANLIGYWESEGFCQFQHGKMFTVNPDDWQSAVDMWLHGTPYEQLGRFYAIRRTAFGQVMLFNQAIGASTTITPLMGWIDSASTLVCESVEQLETTIGTSLTSPSEYCEKYDVNNEPMFDRALAKFGPVGWNEMFAFEPALVLGGKPTLDNLTKLDWRVHLQLLRSLQAPHVPFTQVNVPKSALEP